MSLEMSCSVNCWQVHLLNDDARGATVEAVISRMKTVQSTTTRHGTDRNTRAGMRLLAISATIPNVEDVSLRFHFLKKKVN